MAKPPIVIMGNFLEFENKMRAAGMGDAAILAFKRNYEALLRNETGMIPESSICPAANLPISTSLDPTIHDPNLVSQVCVIKLNGGLGTGMGLQAAKSLLPIRNGTNFLDLMVQQILDLRQTSAAPVRLLLMNSFNTSADTLAHLAAYQDVGLANAGDVELMQNQIPKIDASSFAPVSWASDPSLEWCPPGHGDLYPALVGSGWLDKLLQEGVRYAFVSNSDNLGAVMDPAILQYFATSNAPFLMEVTRRTPADRKGGHLAKRLADDRLLLREIAQCPDSDLDAFQDINRHSYFNTNSLWLRLDLLKQQLEADSGVLPLPMIRNNKTVDPRDKSSTKVIQLEVAMGAAIECFDGALAIEVPRNRFAPVKTCSDLLALRSDAYEILPNGQVQLHPSRNSIPPFILLSDEYKLVDSLESLGVPSLIDCKSLEISGLVHFEPGVILQGEIKIINRSNSRMSIPAGTYTQQTLEN